MERPLNVKPDDDKVEERAGPLFLREYEKGALAELEDSRPSPAKFASDEDKGKATQEKTDKAEEQIPTPTNETPSGTQTSK